MPNSAQQYATGLVGLIGGMARGSAARRLSHHGAGQGLARSAASSATKLWTRSNQELSAATFAKVVLGVSVSNRSGLAPQRAQRSGSIAAKVAAPSTAQDQR